jgi:hypothetical protein
MSNTKVTEQTRGLTRGREIPQNQWLIYISFLKKIVIAGYLIPAGWKVLPILCAVHLDPALHVNPEQFLPCRWEVYYCIDFLLESVSISSIRPISGV